MRTYPLDRESFFHYLETTPHFYQGLTQHSGYMVEVTGSGCAIDQEFEDLDLLYKQYKAFFTSIIRTLKLCPLYYLEIEYLDGLLMMNVAQYYTDQAFALDFARLRDLSYIYSIHGKEHIHMKG